MKSPRSEPSTVAVAKPIISTSPENIKSGSMVTTATVTEVVMI